MPVDADITHTLRPLTNGISAKPAIERLDSQGEEQVNLLSDPARGLRRRPGTEFVSDALDSDLGSVLGRYFYHIIEGTDDETFLMVIGDNLLLVYNLEDGVSQTVVGGTVAYLNDSRTNNSARRTYDKFAASSTLDTTFITNRDFVPLMASTTSPVRQNQMLIYSKITHPAKDYIVNVESVGGTPHTFEVLAATENTEEIDPSGTTDVAAAIYAALVALVAASPDLNWPEAGGGVDAGGYGLATIGSIVYGYQNTAVTNTYSDGTDRVEAHDDQGNTNIFAWNQKVQAFKDLPANGPDGFVFEITGEDASNFDNYWVVFEKFDIDDAQPVNRWRETVQPGIKLGFDADTMPHKLVKTGASTFTFSTIDWHDRKVGDEDSAPLPSFMGDGVGTGSPIRDLTIFANRLFMVAGESLIGSENGSYFNFWPTTVAAVLDSDPIDVSGASNQSAEWDWITPYNETLILHSSNAPMQSRYGVKGDAVTPTTSPPKKIAAFPVSQHVRPVVVGDKLYIMGSSSDPNSASLAGVNEVNEMYVDQNDNVRSNPLLLNNPDMIDGEIIGMSGSSAKGMLILYAHLKGPWVYTFKEDQGEKIQGGWSNWRFNLHWSGFYESWIHNSVKFIGFSKERAFTVSLYDNEINMMDFRKQQTEDFSSVNNNKALNEEAGELIYLDQQTIVTGVYDAGTDLTTWTLPYVARLEVYENDVEQYHAIGTMNNGDFEGQKLEGLSYTDKSAVVTKSGDWAEPTLFGISFVSFYDPGEITVPSRQQGQARTHGHLNLKRLTAHVTKSGPFKAIVTFTDSPNDEFVAEMSNTELVGLPDPSAMDELVLYSGEFTFDAGGSSDVTRVRLLSDSYLGFNMFALEWNGRYYARARQT